jgi:glucose-fructose oxidoreductase
MQKGAGGGPVWDIGTYCINAARNIFGAEPLEVSAYAHKGSDERFTEVEEGMSVLMKFPNDRHASFHCSFGASPRSHYEVVGTKASLLLENAFEYVSPRKLTLQMEEKKQVFKYKKCDQFAPELVYFSDCVLNNKNPEPSGLEGQGDVNTILAIYRSAAEGRPVKVSTSKDVSQKARPTKKMRMYRPGVKKVETVHALAES